MDRVFVFVLRISSRYVYILNCFISRHDTELFDEENEDEIIRRQRLRREKFKQVRSSL
jgi:hypothetical protein